MDLENLMSQIIAYGKANTGIVLVAAVIMLLLTIFKPKMMFKVYGACLVALVGLYLLSLFTGAMKSGSAQKDRMIYKTQDAAGE